ncbi:protein TolR [Aestuariispira insulae]|uniref:Cell division and transport-associated protein TolR n=1 Tax=Aestuariispira insulae TaxID=1461337 RepID=A0A3D9HJZ1_9PROT|nr:protein TolR [Aestuariispira insulae]RED49788.1 cell division and transport-associated protein TolR [Aestuariispira insulae]
MAGQLMGRNGNGGSGSRRYRAMSEINVTPFVDVMLVLLIVFMVTAPLMTVGVPLDLPKTKAAQLTDTDEPLVLSIDKDGRIYLQETEIGLEQLVPRLQAITGNNPEIRIFVRGDKELPYGEIMQVMGLMTSAGFKKVALLAKLPGQK